MAEFDGAVAQDLRGHLFKKGRFVGNEPAVLLIDRDIFAGRSDHPPLDVAVIAIFLDFGIIDESRTAHPA